MYRFKTPPNRENLRGELLDQEAAPSDGTSILAKKTCHLRLHKKKKKLDVESDDDGDEYEDLWCSTELQQYSEQLNTNYQKQLTVYQAKTFLIVPETTREFMKHVIVVLEDEFSVESDEAETKAIMNQLQTEPPSLSENEVQARFITNLTYGYIYSPFLMFKNANAYILSNPWESTIQQFMSLLFFYPIMQEKAGVFEIGTAELKGQQYLEKSLKERKQWLSEELIDKTTLYPDFFCVIKKLSNLVPTKGLTFFVCEMQKEHFRDNQVANHKDYRKIILFLRSVIKAWLEALQIDEYLSIENANNIRVYGALIANFSISFIEMRMEFEENFEIKVSPILNLCEIDDLCVALQYIGNIIVMTRCIQFIPVISNLDTPSFNTVGKTINTSKLYEKMLRTTIQHDSFIYVFGVQLVTFESQDSVCEYLKIAKLQYGEEESLDINEQTMATLMTSFVLTPLNNTNPFFDLHYVKDTVTDCMVKHQDERKPKSNNYQARTSIPISPNIQQVPNNERMISSSRAGSQRKFIDSPGEAHAYLLQLIGVKNTHHLSMPTLINDSNNRIIYYISAFKHPLSNKGIFTKCPNIVKVYKYSCIKNEESFDIKAALYSLMICRLKQDNIVQQNSTTVFEQEYLPSTYEVYITQQELLQELNLKSISSQITNRNLDFEKNTTTKVLLIVKWIGHCMKILTQLHEVLDVMHGNISLGNVRIPKSVFTDAGLLWYNSMSSS